MLTQTYILERQADKTTLLNACRLGCVFMNSKTCLYFTDAHGAKHPDFGSTCSFNNWCKTRHKSLSNTPKRVRCSVNPTSDAQKKVFCYSRDTSRQITPSES